MAVGDIVTLLLLSVLCSVFFFLILCRIFESVFSYIFGDGNPNSDIGQRRVEAAAKV